MRAGRRPDGKEARLSIAVALVATSLLVSFALVAACAVGTAPSADDDAGNTNDDGGGIDDSAGPSPDAIDFVPDGSRDGSDGAARDQCQGQPESHQWDPNDPLARCCRGVAVIADSGENCGVCGIKCNAANGESCQEFNGHWFCRGCIANSGCWSGCCATSYSPPSCSPADCMGHCRNDICPSGSHCVNGTNTSDYCAY